MTQQKSNRPAILSRHWYACRKNATYTLLKLSDWGVKEEELPLMVQNARDTMGSLFTLVPASADEEEVLQIYQKSFR